MELAEIVFYHCEKLFSCSFHNNYNIKALKNN